MKFTNRKLGWLAAIICAACITISFTTACNKSTLASGGVYAPDTNTVATAQDKAFYQVDAAFSLAHATLDFAFNFERDNRALCWKISPDIKHSLDKIRPQASSVVQRYTALRDTYEKTKDAGIIPLLEALLTQLEPLANQAQTSIYGAVQFTTPTK